MEINEPESILPTSSKSLLSSEEEDSSSKKSARNVRKKIFIDPSLEKIIEILKIPMNLRSFEDNAHLIFLLKSFDLEFIEEIIEFHGIDLLEQLINIMDYKFLKADEILFQKKEIANFCYLLLDGKIGCCMNNIDMINSRLKKKKRGKKRENNLNNIMKNLSEISDYSKGEIIAEFQVLSEEAEKYSLTSICKEDCHLICFPKELYKNIVLKNRLKVFEEKDKFFKDISIFNDKTGEFIQDFKLKILHKNQNLYKQNDPSDYLYIIKSGTFKIKQDCDLTKFDLNTNKEIKLSQKVIDIAVISSKQICGEEELLFDISNRKYTVTCISLTGEAYFLKKKHLFKYFSLDPFAKIHMKNFAKQKNQMHKSFFLQISQITNQNKFLLKDMNNVSSKNKIQKYLNELKQNPVPFNPKMFITHNQKSNNVKEINTNSNQVYLPSITKSAINTQGDKKNHFFSFYDKSLEPNNNNSNISNSDINFHSFQSIVTPTQKSEFIKETQNILSESKISQLLHDDYLKEVSQTKLTKKISSSDDQNVDRKISELYPTFQKYSDKTISFLRNYLFDLRSNQKKEDSRQMRNVKEKLSQIQPKSVNDQIQNIKKLFNFYAIKKHETADISKENIRMNFSNKNLKKDELENHKFDEFYNFKLPRNLKYEINFLNEKKEKNFELEENFFDETPIKRKKIDWLEIRKTKKIYYSMKIENENNLKLSRNLYCE